MADIQAEKQKLAQDFTAVVADAESLLKAIASTGGDKAKEMRAELADKLQAARGKLSELEAMARERGRVAAKQADTYVHENPWEAVAIAAAIAGVIGMVVGLLLNRR
jgi:ElaB/YqjD/DUF883 family membrane-anchored ribosome-binding protein